MVLTAQQVKDMIVGMRSRGLDVGLRDVSFAILSNVFGDEALAYRSTFGDSPDVPLGQYLEQPKVTEVKAAILGAMPETPVDQENGTIISFDDLKAGLISDMRSLEALRDDKDENGVPKLEAKELAQVVGRIADIRVKLTEKFNTTERVVEQRVVVNQKYSSVCSFCGREIAPPPLNP